MLNRSTHLNAYAVKIRERTAAMQKPTTRGSFSSTNDEYGNKTHLQTTKTCHLRQNVLDKQFLNSLRQMGPVYWCSSLLFK